MGMKQLEKTLRKTKDAKDDFADGTVLKWEQSGRYTYAAVKTAAGWYTTAQHFNTHVPQVVQFKELLEIFQEEGVTSVQVATTWTIVGEKSDT